MAAKQLLFNDEARRQLLSGVEQLSAAVKATLGPRGRNVVLDKKFGSPLITKDGVSVAKEIELQNPFQNMGAQMVREVASKTSDIAGDGTTTATVLAEAIFKQGLKNVTAGANPMSLKRGIDKAVEAIVAKLDTIKKDVSESEQVAQVATISANGDSEIGKIIANAMDKVGKDGTITVEEAKTIETTLDVVEGMQFDKGYLSPYFVNNAEEMTCSLEDAYILINEKKISNLNDMLPVLQAVAKTGKPLLIIAEDVEGEALSVLVLNKLKGVFNTLVLKAPAFGDQRKAIMEDIATLTGATVVSSEKGMSLEDSGLEVLGQARKIIATKDQTTIVNGAGDAREVKARIADIEAQAEAATSDYETEQFNKRAAALAGRVAVIKVGGATETEIDEKKYRVDDAVAATKAALDEGIVPGGGVTLVNLSKKIKEDNAGATILKNALKSPFIQITENAGLNSQALLAQVEAAKDGQGVNVMAPEKGIIDLKKAGVIDPARVTREAVQNAVSIAATTITMGALIVDLPEKDNAAAAGAGMGGMY